MLNSRYLHLHQALGLGPMWLKRGAHIQPSNHPHMMTTKQNSHTIPTNKPLLATAIAEIRPSEKQSSLTQTAPATTQQKNEQIMIEQSLKEKIKPVPLIMINIYPSLEELTHDELLSGNISTLLNNMLASINLSPDKVYQTSWMKTINTFTPNPNPTEMVAELPHIKLELELSQAKAIILLGKAFEKTEYQEERLFCGAKNVLYFNLDMNFHKYLHIKLHI